MVPLVKKTSKKGGKKYNELTRSGIFPPGGLISSLTKDCGQVRTKYQEDLRELDSREAWW